MPAAGAEAVVCAEICIAVRGRMSKGRMLGGRSPNIQLPCAQRYLLPPLNHPVPAAGGC